jgi:hypothetical protein
MRGDQLARQWRILRAIESKKYGTTVAELAAQEDCSPRTIWRDLSAIEPARLTSLLQSDQVRYSPRQLEAQAKTGKPQLARDAMTMEVGGLVEVMSWVMGVAEVVPEGAMSFRLEHFERFERAPRSNDLNNWNSCFTGANVQMSRRSRI